MIELRFLGIAVLGFLIVLESTNAFASCEIKPASDLVIDVKSAGALGDGSTDDTKALQKALDGVSLRGGTVVLPVGTYLVDAKVGLRIKSNTVFKLSQGAIIKAMPNAVDTFSILRIYDASNVAIVGGQLKGERHEHQGSTGEWGMGLSLHGASDVVIKDMVSKDNWGDGFYVAGKSKNVQFCSVVADGNRRQGLSIVSGTGILVTDSVFSNTRGVPPQAGIDIEPNADGAVRDVQIMRSRFLSNAGSGIASYLSSKFKDGSISAISIKGNSFMGNGAEGVAIFNTLDAKVTGNSFEKSSKKAILVDGKSRSIVERQNSIRE
ncbi:polygalacturonase [Variovorax boronicumulans]|uniref:glycosyl hydrolase family 28-related protein n=1 Tax=Variovorax boronicumulans TaxID=436515 RepID=UPI0024752559|nr:right-handed parallel beta-helix repeat-containing protein [Variovorax boronicumulans]MDH6166708.1 polygalacturonase [Variovorax boronicumulans]